MQRNSPITVKSNCLLLQNLFPLIGFLFQVKKCHSYCVCVCVCRRYIVGVRLSMSLHCGRISTLWEYPHIESHSNACMWPKKPSKGNPTPTPTNHLFKKMCVFMGLQIPQTVCTFSPQFRHSPTSFFQILDLALIHDHDNIELISTWECNELHWVAVESNQYINAVMPHHTIAHRSAPAAIGIPNYTFTHWSCVYKKNNEA